MLYTSTCPPVIKNNNNITAWDIDLFSYFQSKEDVELLNTEYERLYSLHYEACRLAINKVISAGINHCFVPAHGLDTFDVGVPRDICEEHKLQWKYDTAMRTYHLSWSDAPTLPVRETNNVSLLPKQNFSNIDPDYFYLCLWYILHMCGSMCWADIPVSSKANIRNLKKYWSSRGVRIRAAPKGSNFSGLQFAWEIRRDLTAEQEEQRQDYRIIRDNDIKAHVPEIMWFKDNKFEPQYWGAIIKGCLCTLQPLWQHRSALHLCVFTMSGKFLVKSQCQNLFVDEGLTSGEFAHLDALARELVDQLSGHDRVTVARSTSKLKVKLPKPRKY